MILTFPLPAPVSSPEFRPLLAWNLRLIQQDHGPHVYRVRITRTLVGWEVLLPSSMLSGALTGTYAVALP